MKAKQKSPYKRPTLKRYDFGFSGAALGGSAIILAYSITQARSMLKKEYAKSKTLMNKYNGEMVGYGVEKNDFWIEPQVINFDDGDY